MTDETCTATALVHEAFIRLVDQRAVRWQNRAHFFGIAAKARDAFARCVLSIPGGPEGPPLRGVEAGL